MPFLNVGYPSLSGVMIENQSYQVLSTGLTDRIFLLGHSDMPLNEPYQVLDVQAAVQALGTNPTCPLLKGLLETYYAGARDIWLVPVAPMSEYISDPTKRTNAYYQTYSSRLQVTYNLLLPWDLPQIVVPLEAPFYYVTTGTLIDFLTPLAQFCSDNLNKTGSMCIGLLGTRKGSPLNNTDIIAMSTDQRVSSDTINTNGAIGKFVSVFVGEGVFSLQEMPNAYIGSLVTSVAAALAQLSLDQTVVNKPLPNVVNQVGNLSTSQIIQLTNTRLNPIGTTTAGKRGTSYQVIALSDATLGSSGTDYWSLAQVRLVMQIIDYVQALGRKSIGTIGYEQYKNTVQNFFAGLVRQGFLRTYTVNIQKAPDRTITADISVTPYIGLRTISFNLTVGPGA